VTVHYYDDDDGDGDDDDDDYDDDDDDDDDVIARDTDLPSSRYAAVAAGVVKRLLQLGAEVHYVDSGSDGGSTVHRQAPMMWRFTVIDDKQVQIRRVKFTTLNLYSLRKIQISKPFFKFLVKLTSRR